LGLKTSRCWPEGSIEFENDQLQGRLAAIEAHLGLSEADAVAGRRLTAASTLCILHAASDKIQVCSDFLLLRHSSKLTVVSLGKL
jgi:hypothetical protein